MIGASMLGKDSLQHLADAEIRRATVAARGFAVRATISILAVLLTVIGVAIFALAIFLDLSPEHGHLMAGLVVSGALIGVAIVVLLFGFLVFNRRAMIVADAEVRVARSHAAAQVKQALVVGKLLSPGRSAGRFGALAALALGVIIGLRR